MASFPTRRRVSISRNPANATTQLSFTCFPNLPSELQLQIWRYVLPDPRSIRRAILFSNDLDLGKTRAIIPSMSEVTYCIRMAMDDDDFFTDVEEEEVEGGTVEDEYQKAAKAMFENPELLAVFTVFHTCRASRMIARELYRLNMDSIVQGENEPLWNPTEDLVVFLVNSGYGDDIWTHKNATHDYEMILHWLSMDRGIPPPSLSSLQHFALFNTTFPTWGFEGHGFPVMTAKNNAMQKCVKNIPSLQSITLLLDPGKIAFHDTGKILLYESEDKLVEKLHLYPEAIVSHVTRLFEATVEDKDDVPLVELYVAGRRAPRKVRTR